MFPSFFYGQIPKIKYKLFSYYIDYVEKKGYCREWMPVAEHLILLVFLLHNSTHIYAFHILLS